MYSHASFKMTLIWQDKTSERRTEKNNTHTHTHGKNNKKKRKHIFYILADAYLHSFLIPDIHSVHSQIGDVIGLHGSTAK